MEMFKEDHAFSCTINYASLPPGFFERLIVRLRRVSNHVDFNATAAAVYSKGDKLQLFCHDRKAEGEEIRVLFMSTRLFKLFRTELIRIETFFPGLLRDTYTIEIHDFRMAETLSYGQTFNVGLGNSEGKQPGEPVRFSHVAKSQQLKTTAASSDSANLFLCCYKRIQCSENVNSPRILDRTENAREYTICTGANMHSLEGNASS